MSGHCEWQGASGYPREDEGQSGQVKARLEGTSDMRSALLMAVHALGNLDVVRGNSIFLQFTKPKSPGIVSRTAWN